MIEFNEKIPKVEAVGEWVNDRINHQVYAVGQRIPSVRALAKKLNVSPFTVTQAYESLVANGRIEARRGSGYFVSQMMSVTTKVSKVYEDKPVDTEWLMEHLFSEKTYLSHTGSGLLPKSCLKFERLPTITRKVAGNIHQFSYEHSDIRGYLALRKHYSRLLNTVGVIAGSDELLTGDGVSSLLTLTTQYLLQPGDAVIVDNPCWFWLMGNLQAQGLRVFGVERDEQGPNIDQLHHYFKTENATLYLTNSVLQNPTSFNIHPSRAYQVINLLHDFGAYILEDDIYRAFDSDAPALRYAALDRSRVFYTTGVSKEFGGNWRQGVLCGPEEHHERLIKHKMLTQMNSPEFSERLVYSMLTDVSYRKHIGGLRQLLNESHEKMRELLPQYGFTYPVITNIGIFLWLDTGCDSAQLAMAAHKLDYLVAPGQLFSPRQSPSTHIRINVARTDETFLQWLSIYAKTHRVR